MKTPTTTRETGSILIAGSVFMCVFALGVGLSLRTSHRNQTLTNIRYRNDLKVRTAARTMIRHLDQIGTLNSTLFGLHQTYDGCRASAIVLPPMYASCESVRMAIETTAFAARAKLATILANPSGSDFLVERLPWISWWVRFRFETSMTNGLPYQLSHPSLAAKRDVSLVLLDLNSNPTPSGTQAHLSLCGNRCTEHRWRFGG